MIKQNRKIGDCLKLNLLYHLNDGLHNKLLHDKLLANQTLEKFLKKKFPQLHEHINKLYKSHDGQDQHSMEKVGDGFEAILGWLLPGCRENLKQHACDFLASYFDYINVDARKK